MEEKAAWNKTGLAWSFSIQLHQVIQDRVVHRDFLANILVLLGKVLSVCNQIRRDLRTYPFESQQSTRYLNNFPKRNNMTLRNRELWSYLKTARILSDERSILTATV